MSFNKILSIGLPSMARGLLHLILCGVCIVLGEALYEYYLNGFNAIEALYCGLLFLIALTLFLRLGRIGRAGIARDMCETLCYVALVLLVVALPDFWLTDRDFGEDRTVRLVFVPSVLAALHGVKFLHKFIALQREHRLIKDLLMLAQVNMEYMRDAQARLPQLQRTIERLTPDSLRLVRLLDRVKPETRAVLERIAQGSIEPSGEAVSEWESGSPQSRRAGLRLIKKEDRADNKPSGPTNC